MLARPDQDAAQVDERFSVQLHCLYCGAADWRLTQDEGAVVRPGEMLTPAVPPAVKQPDLLAGNRVAKANVIVLVVVAAPARERRVRRTSGHWQPHANGNEE
jgi:hypothetical protein